MKKVIFIFCFGAGLAGTVNAQGISEFNNLQTPSAPGFILLDQTPSAIEKPTTAQGLP